MLGHLFGVDRRAFRSSSMFEAAPPWCEDQEQFFDGSAYTVETLKVGTVILSEYRRPRQSKSKLSFASLRLSSAATLLHGRHGGPCDTDDGEH